MSFSTLSKNKQRRSKVGEYEELFKFAAKAGALEGYLYEREKVDPLDNWINNIVSLHSNLPDSIKEDIKSEFTVVLTRTLQHGQSVLEKEITTKLDNLLLSL